MLGFRWREAGRVLGQVRTFEIIDLVIKRLLAAHQHYCGIICQWYTAPKHPPDEEITSLPTPHCRMASWTDRASGSLSLHVRGCSCRWLPQCNLLTKRLAVWWFLSSCIYRLRIAKLCCSHVVVYRTINHCASAIRPAKPVTIKDDYETDDNISISLISAALNNGGRRNAFNDSILIRFTTFYTRWRQNGLKNVNARTSYSLRIQHRFNFIPF